MFHLRKILATWKILKISCFFFFQSFHILTSSKKTLKFSVRMGGEKKVQSKEKKREKEFKKKIFLGLGKSWSACSLCEKLGCEPKNQHLNNPIATGREQPLSTTGCEKWTKIAMEKHFSINDNFTINSPMQWSAVNTLGDKVLY